MAELKLTDRAPVMARLKTYDRPATADRLRQTLNLTNSEVRSGRYRISLYRFLAENIPAVHACLWTWVRLAAAPGQFEIEAGSDHIKKAAENRLGQLSQRLYSSAAGNRAGLATMLPDLFSSLFRDGLFGGFVAVNADGSGVDQFIPVDSKQIVYDASGKLPQIYIESGENKSIGVDRDDFYLVPLSAGITHPLGQSILQAVPFVGYIEQQLVDDMRRTSHNSGFHRLHVRVTPPERMSGESDKAYIDRINNYFDSTVTMIKSCEVDDNPVTWDNVEISQVGPQNVQSVTNSWFMNHRAMIEEICAGTNLAPFLLGYSYGATTTWSSLKFDVVMRQVRSVQSEVARFMEWLGAIDLALAGIKAECRFVFDNTFAYQNEERVRTESSRVDNLLRLYESGLIDKKVAQDKAERLI